MPSTADDPGAPCILIIDEDTPTAQTMVRVLRDGGYHVLTAPSQAALHVAGARRPAVILLTLDTPGTGAEALAYQLRRDPQTCDIPLVALAPFAGLAAPTADLPVHDRLAMPCHFGDLCAVVARWCAASPIVPASAPGGPRLNRRSHGSQEQRGLR